MVNRYTYVSILSLCTFALNIIKGVDQVAIEKPLHAAPSQQLKDNLALETSLFDSPPVQTKREQELVPFSFAKRSLVDIIDFLSAKKKVNIILPQLAADAEVIKKQVVTYEPEGSTTLPLDEAWSLLTMFLELSGFSLVPKRSDLYAIVRTGKAEEGGVTRDTLPLYVGTPPEKLPQSEQRIRYIYYLRNLRTPGAEDRETNPLARIFRELLSPGAPVIPEPKTNGFIIVDRADIIASVMRIIRELDASGFRETLLVVPVYNLAARDIVRVFDSLKKAAGEAPPSPFIRSDAKSELSYFAADTKIIPDDRTNSLILMGRQTALERISDFVHEYMDVPQESGKSILHTYNLQYLDAQTFAGVLQNIVAPSAAGPQATQGPPGGPERAFQGVVVAAEEVKTVETRSTTEEVTLEQTGGATGGNLGIEGKIFTGGNRLIVAALQDDWLRIKDLIETLDKPQPQVILEVLILDVTAIREKLIAGDVRSLTDNISNQGLQFLSTQISPAANVLANPPTKLAEDLLTLIGGGPPASLATFLASTGAISGPSTPGSMIISFNDPRTPGIAALLQIFDMQTANNVISHPFLVTTNNQKATIASQTIQRAQGDAIPGAAGVTTVEIVDVSATLQVQMIPRLSSLERLSLQVAVDINSFIGATLNRTIRRVNTNANLNTGQVLVIGGLTQVIANDSVSETPILSKIPIIGSFFRKIDKQIEKNNIAIFIAPTIVQPKLRSGLSLYTKDKIRRGRRDISDEYIFTADKDPITYIYFRPGPKSDDLVHQYLSHTSNQPTQAELRTKREIKRETRKPRRRRPLKVAPPLAPQATAAEVPA